MNSYQDFLDFLQNNPQAIFIEVEGRQNNINQFVADYNQRYNCSVSMHSPGICILGQDVDKWGIEYRIYLKNINNMPSYWADRQYNNRRYRANEFSYRVDDKGLVEYLFNNGYRIGYN